MAGPFHPDILADIRNIDAQEASMTSKGTLTSAVKAEMDAYRQQLNDENSQYVLEYNRQQTKAKHGDPQLQDIFRRITPGERDSSGELVHGINPEGMGKAQDLTVRALTALPDLLPPTMKLAGEYQAELLGQNPEETFLHRGGSAAGDLIDTYAPTNESFDEDYSSKLASGVGSAVGAVGLGALTGPAAPAALFFGSAGHDKLEEARAAGDPHPFIQSLEAGTAEGALEYVTQLFHLGTFGKVAGTRLGQAIGRIAKPELGKEAISSVVKRVMLTSGIEEMEEFLQALYSGMQSRTGGVTGLLSESKGTDPDSEWLPGYTPGVGAIAGGGMGAVAGAQTLSADKAVRAENEEAARVRAEYEAEAEKGRAAQDKAIGKFWSTPEDQARLDGYAAPITEAISARVAEGAAAEDVMTGAKPAEVSPEEMEASVKYVKAKATEVLTAISDMAPAEMRKLQAVLLGDGKRSISAYRAKNEPESEALADALEHIVTKEIGARLEASDAQYEKDSAGIMGMATDPNVDPDALEETFEKLDENSKEQFSGEKFKVKGVKGKVKGGKLVKDTVTRRRREVAAAEKEKTRQEYSQAKDAISNAGTLSDLQQAVSSVGGLPITQHPVHGPALQKLVNQRRKSLTTAEARATAAKGRKDLATSKAKAREHAEELKKTSTYDLAEAAANASNAKTAAETNKAGAERRKAADKLVKKAEAKAAKVDKAEKELPAKFEAAEVKRRDQENRETAQELKGEIKKGIKKTKKDIGAFTSDLRSAAKGVRADERATKAAEEREAKKQAAATAKANAKSIATIKKATSKATLAKDVDALTAQAKREGVLDAPFGDGFKGTVGQYLAKRKEAVKKANVDKRKASAAETKKRNEQKKADAAAEKAKLAAEKQAQAEMDSAADMALAHAEQLFRSREIPQTELIKLVNMVEPGDLRSVKRHWKPSPAALGKDLTLEKILDLVQKRAAALTKAAAKAPQRAPEPPAAPKPPTPPAVVAEPAEAAPEPVSVSNGQTAQADKPATPEPSAEALEAEAEVLDLVDDLVEVGEAAALNAIADTATYGDPVVAAIIHGKLDESVAAGLENQLDTDSGAMRDMKAAAKAAETPTLQQLEDAKRTLGVAIRAAKRDSTASMERLAQEHKADQLWQRIPGQEAVSSIGKHGITDFHGVLDNAEADVLDAMPKIRRFLPLIDRMVKQLAERSGAAPGTRFGGIYVRYGAAGFFEADGRVMLNLMSDAQLAMGRLEHEGLHGISKTELQRQLVKHYADALSDTIAHEIAHAGTSQTGIIPHEMGGTDAAFRTRLKHVMAQSFDLKEGLRKEMLSHVLRHQAGSDPVGESIMEVLNEGVKFQRNLRARVRRARGADLSPSGAARSGPQGGEAREALGAGREGPGRGHGSGLARGAGAVDGDVGDQFASVTKPTIEVDGVQRSTQDSEGQQIHPTEEGVRNFWRWFGDSKVVDEQGRPVVMYHGTRAGSFSELSAEESYGEFGVHFGSRAAAAEFAGLDGGMYPVYLRITAPLETTDSYGSLSWAANGVSRALMDAHGAKDYEIRERLSVHTGSREDVKARYIEVLKEYGHDGISYQNAVEGAARLSDSYHKYTSQAFITIDSAQAKSAIGNTGAFDSSSRDLTASLTPDPDSGSDEALVAIFGTDSEADIKRTMAPGARMDAARERKKKRVLRELKQPGKTLNARLKEVLNHAEEMVYYGPKGELEMERREDEQPGAAAKAFLPMGQVLKSMGPSGEKLSAWGLRTIMLGDSMAGRYRSDMQAARRKAGRHWNPKRQEKWFGVIASHFDLDTLAKDLSGMKEDWAKVALAKVKQARKDIGFNPVDMRYKEANGRFHFPPKKQSNPRMAAAAHLVNVWHHHDNEAKSVHEKVALDKSHDRLRDPETKELVPHYPIALSIKALENRYAKGDTSKPIDPFDSYKGLHTANMGSFTEGREDSVSFDEVDWSMERGHDYFHAAAKEITKYAFWGQRGSNAKGERVIVNRPETAITDAANNTSDKEFASKYVQSITGIIKGGLGDKTALKLARQAVMLQYGVKLSSPLQAALNLTQNFTLGATLGLLNTSLTLMKVVAAGAASRFGIDTATGRQMARARMSGAIPANQEALSKFGGLEGHAISSREEAITNFARKMMKYSGFTMAERINNYVAAIAGWNKANKLLDQYRKGSGRQKAVAKRVLNKMFGLSDSQIARAARDANGFSEHEEFTLRQMAARNIHLRSDAHARPGLFEGQGAVRTILTQFKTFPAGMTKGTWDHILKEAFPGAGKPSNPQPLLSALAGATLAGELLKWLKDFFRDDERESSYVSDDLGLGREVPSDIDTNYKREVKAAVKHVVENISEVGLLGMGDRPADLLHLKKLAGPVASAVDDVWVYVSNVASNPTDWDAYVHETLILLDRQITGFKFYRDALRAHAGTTTDGRPTDFAGYMEKQARQINNTSRIYNRERSTDTAVRKFMAPPIHPTRGRWDSQSTKIATHIIRGEYAEASAKAYDTAFRIMEAENLSFESAWTRTKQLAQKKSPLGLVGSTDDAIGKFERWVILNRADKNWPRLDSRKSSTTGDKVAQIRLVQSVWDAGVNTVFQ